VLLGSALALLRRETLAGGLGLGLALLARPDFVLWVGPALGAVALEDRRRAAKTAGLAALVVAPWLAFTTAYYGSPVPHTILAKAGASPAIPTFTGSSPGAWLGWGVERLSLHRYDWARFSPFLSDGFLAEAPVHWALLGAIGFVFITLGLVGIVVTWRRSWAWRAVSTYVLVFQAYRLALLPVLYFEWYYPPPLALFALEAAAGLTWLARRSPRGADGLSAFLALAFAAPLPWMFVIERRIEHEIETPVRREIGLYLRDVVKPGETVGCEPAGYIGFYSGATLYDWPGLTSPTVRRALAQLPREERTLEHTIAILRPDWIVLRPDELQRLVGRFPQAAVHYKVDRTFDAHLPPDRLTWAGLTKTDLDDKYYVLKKAQ
jgi:hypothetical protein